MTECLACAHAKPYRKRQRTACRVCYDTGRIYRRELVRGRPGFKTWRMCACRGGKP